MTDDRRLSKTARDLLGSTAETRINAIQSIPFISYAAAKLIRARMEQIVIAPRSHRPASMLIAGSTNNGKTMLVRKFVESHPQRRRVISFSSLRPNASHPRSAPVLYGHTRPITIAGTKNCCFKSASKSDDTPFRLSKHQGFSYR
jgi:hypothetical protein